MTDILESLDIWQGKDSQFNHDNHFRALEALHHKSSPQALQARDKLRDVVLDYLKSDASYEDPRALELLYTFDGKVDHQIYWHYLRWIAESDATMEDGFRNDIAPGAEARSNPAKARLLDWLACNGLRLAHRGSRAEDELRKLPADEEQGVGIER